MHQVRALEPGPRPIVAKRRHPADHQRRKPPGQCRAIQAQLLVQRAATGIDQDVGALQQRQQRIAPVRLRQVQRDRPLAAVVVPEEQGPLGVGACRHRTGRCAAWGCPPAAPPSPHPRRGWRAAGRNTPPSSSATSTTRSPASMPGPPRPLHRTQRARLGCIRVRHQATPARRTRHGRPGSAAFIMPSILSWQPGGIAQANAGLPKEADRKGDPLLPEGSALPSAIPKTRCILCHGKGRNPRLSGRRTAARRWLDDGRRMRRNRLMQSPSETQPPPAWTRWTPPRPV